MLDATMWGPAPLAGTRSVAAQRRLRTKEPVSTLGVLRNISGADAMPKAERPEEKLAELERRIAEAEIEIALQAALMDRLAGDGQDTTEVHAHLNLMKRALLGPHAHRRYLLRGSKDEERVSEVGPEKEKAARGKRTAGESSGLRAPVNRSTRKSTEPG